MKKVILYIISFIIIILISFFIFKKDEIKSEIISVNKAYSLTDDQNLYINLYFTKKDHLITKYDAIYNINISNDISKLTLDFQNVNYVGMEYYLNKDYYIYQYELLLPSVEERLIINDAIFNINLENGVKYNFEIGKISLEPVITNNNYTWTKLEGRRLDYNLYPRIGLVNVLFLNLDYNLINYITDSFNNKLVYYHNEDNENDLLINIKNENYILDAFPLSIHFLNGEILQLPYFNYMLLSNVLNEAGPLLNVYYDD